MLKKIFCVIILIVMLLSVPYYSFAETVTSLKNKQDDLKDQQDEVQDEKSAVEKEVKKLSDSIADNEDKLADINSQLVKLNKEIKELNAELKEAEEKHAKQEEALKEKMILSYEMGQVSYLDVLLNSKGILDFLSNYYLLSEILQTDNDLLDSIEEQQNKIEKSKKEVEEKQRQVRTQKAEQEKINVLLSNQKTQKQNKISELSKEEKELQKKIDEYDDLIRAEERKASQIASGSSGVYVGGNKVWPCPASHRITSGYGGRNTGIPGASTNHKGIDIGCPNGSAVVSVLDGKVIFTGYNRYRGYYIMVDHGGGVVTLYQHCSPNSFKASVGEKVKAGQTIVLSGHSGIGSGPHLHFEVLINGSNVNPSTWLKQG